jgi:hypothetical protein
VAPLLSASLSFKHPTRQVFAPTAGQESVFDEISELVQSALDGHKVRARPTRSGHIGRLLTSPVVSLPATSTRYD